MKYLSIPALACAMTLGFGLASAQTIVPSRVGPVSQYGQLMTGKNSAGEGRIYGSCQGVKDGAEVQVRGMSLYWSLLEDATEFWTKEGVATMVRDMNIQIVRAAMATGDENWSGPYKGYQVDGANQTKLMKTVVEAAIEQDIYVIIDWHSHNANNQTSSAQGFFSEMAQQYGAYNNVIFELFNEPENIAWSDIKNYANQVIPKIRQYSDNLILVGTPKWDQNPDVAINNEVTDSGNNTAYTMHYYANSHCYEGSHNDFADHNGNRWDEDCEGTKTVRAIKAGLSVFVSEWGTANSDGGGSPGPNNAGWQNFMNTYKLSWANWSASKISEGTAAFQGGSNKNSLQYTESGNLVKGYLATNPTSYTACADGGAAVNPSQGGSTVDPSQGGSTVDPSQGGSTVDPSNPWGQQAISYQIAPTFGMTYADRMMNITGPAATVEFFDMQGHKLMSLQNVTGNLSMQSFPAGQYIVRVHNASANISRVINVK